MRINDVLSTVLVNYNYSNREEVVENLSKTYPEKEILQAITTVDDFNKNKGGFILEKKIQLIFPFSENQYQYLLDNFLGHLILNITENCNLACKYCVYGGTYKYRREHNSKAMSWLTIKKAVDFFAPKTKLYLKETDKNATIGFYGGEAFLEHKNLFKTVEYVKEKYPDLFPRFDYRVTTNGTVLTKEILDKLIEYDFKLTFSLDGPEDLHDRNRVFTNGKGTHQTIIKNLELIKRTNLDFYMNNISFYSVFSPEYELPKLLDYLRERFPDKTAFSFSGVEQADTSYFEQFDMKVENETYSRQYGELLMELLDKKLKRIEDPVLFSFIKDRTENFHHRELAMLPQKLFINGCCAPGIKRAFVDTQGQFHVCEKIEPGFTIGDLENGFDIKKIFDLTEQYAESSNHCENCWAVRLCNACYISAIEGGKFSKERKKETCQRFKQVALQNLVTYLYLMERNDKFYDDEEFIPGEDEIGDLMRLLHKYNIK